MITSVNSQYNVEVNNMPRHVDHMRLVPPGNNDVIDQWVGGPYVGCADYPGDDEENDQSSMDSESESGDELEGLW